MKVKITPLISDSKEVEGSEPKQKYDFAHFMNNLEDSHSQSDEGKKDD